MQNFHLVVTFDQFFGLIEYATGCDIIYVSFSTVQANLSRNILNDHRYAISADCEERFTISTQDTFHEFILLGRKVVIQMDFSGAVSCDDYNLILIFCSNHMNWLASKKV